MAFVWQRDACLCCLITRSFLLSRLRYPRDVKIAFSALPAEVAGDIEAAFAQAGIAVFSNAKNYRMHDDVPLLIPEVNADHALALIEQRKKRGWKGSIVTNANCSATPLVMALKPLQEAFGVRKVMVTTLQAISGAGYPGIPSYDILDNAIPYIGGEEEKVESETRKMLGTWQEGSGFTDAPMVVSAQCNRVATREGHLECVSVELHADTSPEEIIAAWQNYILCFAIAQATQRSRASFDLPQRTQPSSNPARSRCRTWHVCDNRAATAMPHSEL